MKQRIAYIVNPISGVSDKRAVISHIEQNVADDTVITVYRTKCKGDATTSAAQFAAEGFDKVVAVGGDGTVNEVARGLLNTDTVLGIIPLGSGNGLARHLKIPLDYRKANNVVYNGNTAGIDCGMINDKPFFCTAGTGFDAQVGYRFAESGRRGFATYAQTSFLEYFNYKPQQYKITVDGETFSRTAFLITFANASQWGYNACIAPDAIVSDGMLDMVILSPFPVIKAPLLGLRVFTKNINNSDNIEVFRFKNAAVERETDGYIHVDGESLQAGKVLEVSCMTKPLKVVMPEKKENGIT